MNLPAMRVLLPGAALFALCSAAGHAQTQALKDRANYPTKPARMLVGFSAGGGTDAMARLFAQKFNEPWGQTVVVDNRPGAGSTSAADTPARSVATRLPPPL